MNSASLNPICALCRGPISQSAGTSTSRLCSDCTSIVETVRPQSSKASPIPGSRERASSLPSEVPVEAERAELALQPTTAPMYAELQDLSRGHAANEYQPVTAAPGADYENDALREWPMVLDQKRAGRRPWILAPALGAVVLLGGAGGFLAYRHFRAEGTVEAAPSVRGQSTGTERDKQVAVPSAPHRETERPAAETASRPGQVPVAQPAVAQSPNPSNSGANPANGSKLTSFQIASFPNEASAKEFCGKLLGAGVPAYVIGANIPGRGKWYRVRAGKFASPEESQQSALAWRRLASAAGISLQLVQCEYEQ